MYNSLHSFCPIQDNWLESSTHWNCRSTHRQSVFIWHWIRQKPEVCPQIRLLIDDGREDRTDLIIHGPRKRKLLIKLERRNRGGRGRFLQNIISLYVSELDLRVEILTIGFRVKTSWDEIVAVCISSQVDLLCLFRKIVANDMERRSNVRCS